MIFIKNGVAYCGLLNYILGKPNRLMTLYWHNHVGEKTIVILREGKK